MNSVSEEHQELIPSTSLFSVIEKGDRKIKKAHKKGIILVGLTRAGKSTVFNWILKVPMVGKGKPISSYVNIVDSDSSAAKVANSFASVTLVPNIHIDYENTVSLIDMAGYEDTRDFVGVIGVSYFLKALFEQVREAKFIIVFDQYKFIEETGEGMIKTFNGFISMFHYNKLPSNLKEKLKKSISIVVTRSKVPQQHYDYLDFVIQKLKDPNFKASNKETVIELMQYVRNSARLQPFKSAREHANPQQCKFLQRFTNGLGWDYFNLDEAQQEIGQSVISLPFEKDFGNLSVSQQNLFDQSIAIRIKSYDSFYTILTVLVRSFLQNWKKVIQLWKNHGKLDLNLLKMGQLFAKISEFAQNNDFYNSLQVIDIPFKTTYQQPSLIHSLKTILQIQDIINSIGQNEAFNYADEKFFKQNMEIFHSSFSNIIELIKRFSSSKIDDQNLQIIKYVICRGFREFEKLYELRKESIASVRQDLRDKCSTAFDQKEQIFINTFVKQFSPDLLVKLFPNLTLLDEYSNFFATYEEKYKSQENSVFFSEQKCNLEMAKASLLYDAGERYKTLLCYIEALRSIGEISRAISKSDRNQSERNQYLNKLSMKKIKLIRLIANNLKNIPETEEFRPKTYALQLCLKYKMLDDCCLIYQSIIDSLGSNFIEKSKIYEDYANFCAKWGRLEQAIILFQKKMALEEDDFESYTNTVNSMRQITSSKDTLIKEFNTSLGSMGRLPENDEDLEEKLSCIEQQIKRIMAVPLEKSN